MHNISQIVRIRPWEMSDIPAMAKYANNYKIWLNVRDRFPHPYTEEHARDWVKHNISATPVTNFAIVYEGEAVGAVGLELQQDIHRKSAEVGYWLGEEFWGKGIAAMALQQLVLYAFENFDLERLYAFVHTNNSASMRVLQKAGFAEEAILRKAIIKNGELMDEHIFSLLRT